MKKTINGDKFVKGNSKGNYIEIKDGEEKIKISECDDNEEFILTGKQLKQFQKFWKHENDK